MVILFPIKPLPSKRDIAIPLFFSRNFSSRVLFSVPFRNLLLQFPFFFFFYYNCYFNIFHATSSIDNSIAISLYRVRFNTIRTNIFVVSTRCCRYLIKIKRPCIRFRRAIKDNNAIRDNVISINSIRIRSYI